MKQFFVIVLNTFILFVLICAGIYLYGRSTRGRLLPIAGEWGYPKRNPHTLKWKVNSARNKIDADICKINPYANTHGTKHILYLGGLILLVRMFLIKML